MEEKIVNNLKSESRWLRLVFMVVFAFVAYLAAFLVMLIAIVQAVHGFVMGEPNDRLLKFSGGVNQYIYQIAGFLTYNVDVKPYPFSDWPASGRDRAFGCGEKAVKGGEKELNESDND
ncbi:DUF4389 domain-containing protein [Endozoicomonas sp. SCSIO W0465]|uniref:DUF4389 domain-containing protein n=1 Tax=Endozoicomonas sp. SCSIO W0465 TaxID=2918516 RepID=UPI002074FF1C|nr:DUF4389 domain-containing protein [Endozoicomonas sp. SCSIO W0465]USE39288.1 DUF4389 domain-containing protein [Endozoicomonas sp. SCSIO W0465]